MYQSTIWYTARPVSASFARHARMCSAPQNSGTSVISTVPPCRISSSAARPRAGLAESPEKPSDPPHLTPIDSALIGAGVRVIALATGSIASTASRPRFTDPCVPPASWMPMRATGLLSGRCWSLRYFSITVRLVFSHPSPMNTTPPTLGCSAYAASVRSITSMFEPSEQPHPLLWGIATTPSTLGYFALSKIVNSATVAICTASWARTCSSARSAPSCGCRRGHRDAGTP